MTIAEGFAGQRMVVVPRPLVSRALHRPGTAHVVVTDCGYYPDARNHGVVRRTGVGQAIIVLCTRGRGRCTVRGETHAVGPGQVLLIPPGIGHEYLADPDDPWTIWWLHLAGADVVELLGGIPATSNLPVRSVIDVYAAVTIIEQVVSALEHDLTERSQLLASGGAWYLLAQLAAGTREPGDETSAVDQAQEYLRAHLTERVSVADLAALANLSPSHFAALFRHRFGVPVLRYQTQLRMAAARELLDTTDRSIAAVAGAVGYADPFYFSRQFTALHGLSPRNYRAQVKG